MNIVSFQWRVNFVLLYKLHNPDEYVILIHYIDVYLFDISWDIDYSNHVQHT